MGVCVGGRLFLQRFEGVLLLLLVCDVVAMFLLVLGIHMYIYIYYFACVSGLFLSAWIVFAVIWYFDCFSWWLVDFTIFVGFQTICGVGLSLLGLGWCCSVLRVFGCFCWFWLCCCVSVGIWLFFVVFWVVFVGVL